MADELLPRTPIFSVERKKVVKAWAAWLTENRRSLTHRGMAVFMANRIVTAIEHGVFDPKFKMGDVIPSSLTKPTD